MIKAIIRWIGDAFLSGYEVRLTAKLDELIEGNKEIKAILAKNTK